MLERTGLLPHLNPGVMSVGGDVPPQARRAVDGHDARDHRHADLFTEKGAVHYGSPDKDPDVRLRVLDDAGRLSIPFTTGILVGIGENARGARRLDHGDPGHGPGSSARSRK